MAVTAAQVKELREMSGAGMMDCKNALVECDGDMEKAIDWLRQKGIAKSAKKASRIAAEGLSRVVVDGDKAIVVEINSETDFVAKNEQFLALLDKTAEVILAAAPADNEAALALPVDGRSEEHTSELQSQVSPCCLEGLCLPRSPATSTVHS